MNTGTSNGSTGAINRSAEELGELARDALRDGTEEQTLPILRRATERQRDARLWQWTGLLQRALDDHQDAIRSFTNAARLAPDDQGIAHGRARVAFEAGLDAVALFEAARKLGPAKGDLLIGHAAARFAAGRGEEAVADLDSILLQVPLWLEGHVQLAQLRSLLGRADEAADSLERALGAYPRELALWNALLALRLRQENHRALAEATSRAVAAGLPGHLAVGYQAIAAAELGEVERADALFESAPPAAEAGLAIWRIRHFLRTSRIARALPLIDAELASERAAGAWPYAAAAWRLSGDPRWAWLEGDERFVSVLDIGSDLPDLALLANRLRSLHVARAEYLDQSVRGGTQTDGPLLSRIEPEIQKLRSAIVGAVERHVAQLPPVDPRHPLLAKRRDRRIRFAGSWSVRLRGAGYHASHVHPQGWISSALYVSLPNSQASDDPNAGWLTLGEPQPEIGISLPPLRQIEPRPGRLALFPSWMWHGTVPFGEGERLTVAFDVAPPR